MKTGKIDLTLSINSDYDSSMVDRRSTTGHYTMLGENLATWKSKKQIVVSKSSTEAEFRAMSNGIDKVLWIRSILQELQIPFEDPIRVFCDNRSTISIAHDSVYHDRIKHVNIYSFYIKEKPDAKILETSFLSSTEQCANIFTKGLPIKAFSKVISMLGMKYIHSCT